MFAVLKTGGKQYRVSEGDILKVEKLTGESGDAVSFGDVLVLGGDDLILGAPFVPGASVRGEILEQKKDRKVINFVRRRRKASSKRKLGHRQNVTIVRITEIVRPGGEGSGTATASVEEPASDDHSAESGQE